MAELIRCALEGSVRLSLLTKSALDLHIVVSGHPTTTKTLYYC